MRLHPDREEESFAILERYRALGGNLFDTAEVYGGGQSERALGAYFRKQGGRSDALIVTKGCVDSKLVRPEYIRDAIDRSLERLQTDYIDLYLLHRDDPQVPIGELVDTLNEALQKGKIRAFGGSNWTVARFEEANRYANAKHLQSFTVSSPHLGLAIPREPWWSGCNHATGEDLVYYAEVGMPVLAWSSQCRGFFSKEAITDLAYMAEVIRVYYTKENLERRERLFKLAEVRGLDPAVLAVAYVVALPLPTIALVGPVSLDDLMRVMAVVDVELTTKEIAWLERGVGPLPS
jgi:aryl-alcohol dehydrogenase-like predicted oxidoreductase